MTATIHRRARSHRLLTLFPLVALLVRTRAPWPSGPGPGDVRADDPPGAYKAESPEPTPAETLILEYVNRCRLNPAEDAIRCVQASQACPRNVDANMFKQEMLEAKPAPPLVFDLALLKAARWHSSYQIANGQTHDEEPGKQGYTGQVAFGEDQAGGFPRRHGPARTSSAPPRISGTAMPPS